MYLNLDRAWDVENRAVTHARSALSAAKCTVIGCTGTGTKYALEFHPAVEMRLDDHRSGHLAGDAGEVRV